MSGAGFVALAAGLAALAAAFVLVPLARGRAGGVDAQRARVEAHRRRLAELDAERRAGLLSEADHAEARAEVEAALARELAAGEGAAGSRRARAAAVTVALLAVAGGAALYVRLGEPGLVEGAASPGAGPPGASAPDVDAMVARLEARLRKDPDDARGWMMLGRSYRVLGRAADAARAYGEALRRVDDPPADLLVAFAEARILAAEGEVDPEAARALARALAAEPEHPLGLWLDGLRAFQAGDMRTAVARWERVLATGGAADPEVESLVRRQIAEARRRLEAAGSAAPERQGGGEE